MARIDILERDNGLQWKAIGGIRNLLITVLVVGVGSLVAGVVNLLARAP